MSEYLHGAYGDSRADGNRVSVDAEEAFVCFGTAPVQTLARASGESYNVNKPVVVHNIAEAKAAFGYSDDWAKYTLCEAFHHFFETMGIPATLEAVGITDEDNFEIMAEKAVKNAAGWYVPLTKEEVVRIYQAAK